MLPNPFQWRICVSASTRRFPRAVWALVGRVSVIHSPWQSPYTPLVEPYTSRSGGVRRRKACNKLRVRGSRLPMVGGGARWTIRRASPANRRSVAGLSRLPTNGTIPKARSSGMRSGCCVSAKIRTRRGKCRTTRTPTSPHPTIKTRVRRNRNGKLEGKITPKFQIFEDNK